MVLLAQTVTFYEIYIIFIGFWPWFGCSLLLGSMVLLLLNSETFWFSRWHPHTIYLTWRTATYYHHVALNEHEEARYRAWDDQKRLSDLLTFCLNHPRLVNPQESRYGEDPQPTFPQNRLRRLFRDRYHPVTDSQIREYATFLLKLGLIYPAKKRYVGQYLRVAEVEKFLKLSLDDFMALRLYDTEWYKHSHLEQALTRHNFTATLTHARLYIETRRPLGWGKLPPDKSKWAIFWRLV